MVDRLTREQRSFNMSRVRGKNTKPELVVRRALHAMGYRFRLHRRDLPGSPDIVLPKHRTAVLVHGCFFHGHGCDLFRWPAQNEAFWREKIGGNMARDAKALEALRSSGWRTLVVWECAVKGRGKLSDEELAEGLRAFLEGGSSDEIAGRRRSPSA